MTPVTDTTSYLLATRTRYLPVAVVARKLGVSTRSIRLWAQCGELPAIKVGRQWRIEEASLHQWITNSQQNRAGLRSDMQDSRKQRKQRQTPA